ncbi:ubiquitin fusion degradation protein [Colletotrichum plurivorum]|uniref:Ubiquitin fusion degradation protein n=1 Tax=Colletotrichum plurivorum TaxID=2175906 RepID=A0A8H6NIG6_9PEZI|nr:ubiquitin fusion degradation protein [Colletotrichum plurivorum]
MLQDVDDAYTLYENPAPTLLNLLYNPLILAHTTPYLSAHERLNLASTSRSFRDLVHHTPGVFRHLDLTQVRTAQFDVDGIDRGGEVWRNVQLDENLTEDECVFLPFLFPLFPRHLFCRHMSSPLHSRFYSGPLRGIFSNIRRRNILQDVQTLILDGLAVTADLCHEIILDPVYSVRILSIRGAKNINERKLCASLQYACRPSRPEGTPRLKGLFVFGARDAPVLPIAGRNAKSQEADEWYQKKGRIIARSLVDEWANTLVDCHGIIAFDAVSCSGPHHINSPAYGKVKIPSSARHWAVATVALGGCAGCGAAPEGMTVHKDTPAIQRPLLSPPPVLTSSIKAATMPHGAPGPTANADSNQSFVARCLDCLRERYCAGCNKWWCEECYQTPSAAIELADTDVIIVDAEGGAWVQHQEQQSQPKIKPRITKSCWECGSNVSFDSPDLGLSSIFGPKLMDMDQCHDCIERTQRLCRGCCGGYCLVHNEGSTSTFVSSPRLPPTSCDYADFAPSATGARVEAASCDTSRSFCS